MAHGPAARALPSALARPANWTVRVVEPERDDAALVAACLDGDKGAFDEIVERHRRSVYQVCYRFVNNHEDASDLSQEAFVRAWRGLENFQGHAALSTWLYRITVNVCLNRLKIKKSDTEPLDSDRFEDPRPYDPSVDLVRGERAVAVRRAIAGLPPKQRATLILRTYQDLSHQQIADI